MFSLANLGQLADVRRGLVWSPDELRHQIACSRHSLQRAGVARYDKVVIAHGGTPEFFADLFAAWSLGACCVCINASLSAAMAGADIADDAGIGWLAGAVLPICGDGASGRRIISHRILRVI